MVAAFDPRLDGEPFVIVVVVTLITVVAMQRHPEYTSRMLWSPTTRLRRTLPIP